MFEMGDNTFESLLSADSNTLLLIRKNKTKQKNKNTTKHERSFLITASTELKLITET